MPTNDEKFQNKARAIVMRYVVARLDKSDPPVQFETYVVWFAKTLQNWKALVSTTLPDGMYYEVTYNGDLRETYLDAYKKVDNVRIDDECLGPIEGPNHVEWDIDNNVPASFPPNH